LELNSKPIDYTLTEVAQTFCFGAPAAQFLLMFFRFVFCFG
jgi:hypothetical protein